jgi:hypothetical protein
MISAPTFCSRWARSHRAVRQADRKNDQQDADTNADNAYDRPCRTMEHV